MSGRPTEAQYYLGICKMTAERATCQKIKVGALLTECESGIIIATGYNGAPRGKPHCIDEGCILDHHGKCIRCIHAEANVLISAPRTRKTHLWITHTPCWQCCQYIVNSGVEFVTFSNHYSDPICQLLHFPKIESNIQVQYLLDSNIVVSHYSY